LNHERPAKRNLLAGDGLALSGQSGHQPHDDPAQIFENDPRRTLVGPCGRLVDFHDRLACLDLLADAVTHDSSFVF
jgi:hypothetical protein